MHQNVLCVRIHLCVYHNRRAYKQNNAIVLYSTPLFEKRQCVPHSESTVLGEHILWISLVPGGIDLETHFVARVGLSLPEQHTYIDVPITEPAIVRYSAFLFQIAIDPSFRKYRFCGNVLAMDEGKCLTPLSGSQ